MQVPTIHLNGTPKLMLLHWLEQSHEALEDAIKALKGTAPNGRDYYTQGPAALEQATREHMDRLRRVTDVKDEVAALMVAIERQAE